MTSYNIVINGWSIVGFSCELRPRQASAFSIAFLYLIVRLKCTSQIFIKSSWGVPPSSTIVIGKNPTFIFFTSICMWFSWRLIPNMRLTYYHTMRALFTFSYFSIYRILLLLLWWSCYCCHLYYHRLLYSSGNF